MADRVDYEDWQKLPERDFKAWPESLVWRTQEGIDAKPL